MGNRTDINQALRIAADTVPNGGRGRFLCPSCEGGSSKENSLTIDKEGLTAHCRCWRASCGLGYRRVMSDGCVQQSLTTSRPPRVTRWEGDSELLEDRTKFNLNFYDTPLPIRVTPDGRAVIPILDRSGIRRGDIVRQTKPYDTWKPKSLSFYDEGYDGMAWFRPDDTWGEFLPLCLVEDPISALRLAAHGVIGVALLGTILTRDRVTLLRHWSTTNRRPIHFALDADAYLQAVTQARRLHNQLDLRVHRLFNDVKDMDSKELLNFLGVLGVYT